MHTPLRTVILLILVSCLSPLNVFAQTDSTLNLTQWGASVLAGLSSPGKTNPLTSHNPFGIELTYSRVGTSRKAWEACNCFAKTGFYANYYQLGNPPVLGQTAGAGIFFEPLIGYRHRLYGSVRTSLGISYLSRYFNAETNPTNQFVSLPVSTMIAARAALHYRLTPNWQSVLSVQFGHISNGGTKQPNNGLNLPTIGIGAVYSPAQDELPAGFSRGTPIRFNRWFARATAFGSIRIISRFDPYAGKDLFKDKESIATKMWGADLVGGFRLSRQHALSVGVQYIADGYLKTLMQAQPDFQYRQASVLAGYEFWYGRFTVQAHYAWNFISPGFNFYVRHYHEFQRYSLSYRLKSGLTFGVGVRADRETTKGFHLLTGWTI